MTTSTQTTRSHCPPMKLKRLWLLLLPVSVALLYLSKEELYSHLNYTGNTAQQSTTGALYKDSRRQLAAIMASSQSAAAVYNNVVEMINTSDKDSTVLMKASRSDVEREDYSKAVNRQESNTSLTGFSSSGVVNKSRAYLVPLSTLSKTKPKPSSSGDTQLDQGSKLPEHLASNRDEVTVLPQSNLLNEEDKAATSHVITETGNQPNIGKDPEHRSNIGTEFANLALPEIQLPRNACDVAGLKPWNRKVITELRPPVARDCQLLRQRDKVEINRVSRSMTKWESSESFTQWNLRMSNCSIVLEEFSNNFYISEEEINFPLAFSFVVYDNPRQIMRLLKAIYRSHNVYCIHPDAKQGDDYANIFTTIGQCLGNVFVASKLESIYYLHHSLLDAQLNCLRDFTSLPIERWRYAINLCGKELPLKSNREIVRALKRLKGTSAVDIVGAGSRILENRFTLKVKLDLRFQRIRFTSDKVGPPPHNIHIYKSFTFIAASCSFANYILNSQTAIDFHNYLKEVKIPEEHFYASLYRHGNPPGGYKKGLGEIPIIEEIKWIKGPNNNHCQGEVVHSVCVLSSGDLFDIYRLGVNQKRPRFFFNKYFMEKDHVVMDCLEEELLKQNFAEYNSDCSHG